MLLAMSGLGLWGFLIFEDVCSYILIECFKRYDLYLFNYSSHNHVVTNNRFWEFLSTEYWHCKWFELGFGFFLWCLVFFVVVLFFFGRGFRFFLLGFCFNFCLVHFGGLFFLMHKFIKKYRFHGSEKLKTEKVF